MTLCLGGNPGHIPGHGGGIGPTGCSESSTFLNVAHQRKADCALQLWICGCPAIELLGHAVKGPNLINFNWTGWMALTMADPMNSAWTAWMALTAAGPAFEVNVGVIVLPCKRKCEIIEGLQGNHQSCEHEVSFRKACCYQKRALRDFYETLWNLWVQLKWLG